jgi:aromatic-L-amino-acid decarboxylase
MTPEEFRTAGYRVVDWIANYMADVESFPVRSNVEPGWIRSRLPPTPPDTGESLEAVLHDLDHIVMPGITHWQSPNFFAYFPSNNSGPSILGELLSSGLGVQGMLWATSPACTELETHVLDWLVDMLGLPRGFSSTDQGGGVIQDTASSSTLCALLAARERASGEDTNRHGVREPMIAYGSTEAHSSLDKAVRIAGLGDEHLRRIAVDDNFAMNPAALSAAIQRDRAAGHVPGFVCATVGTTSSNGMDPLRDIGSICKSENVWLHVDAAMSGTAALCPEFRGIHDGLELADSYCFNPHKWMFTNFDCNCFYVTQRDALIRALTIVPEYLRNSATDSGAVFDYRDWHIPLGRRFRSLKLWMVIRHYGVSGLQNHIREHVRLAQSFAQWIEEDDAFELVVRPPLNLVCFRHRGGDDVNLNLMEHLNNSGQLYLTHTRLHDQLTLRLCVGQSHTKMAHVERAWSLIRQTASTLA